MKVDFDDHDDCEHDCDHGNDLDVDHIDEDKTNCHASNLRWVTRRENNTKRDYQRRPKNTPEQAAAAKERQKIAKRDYMRRKRAEEKKAKIEKSNL